MQKGATHFQKSRLLAKLLMQVIASGNKTSFYRWRKQKILLNSWGTFVVSSGLPKISAKK